MKESTEERLFLAHFDLAAGDLDSAHERLALARQSLTLEAADQEANLARVALLFARLARARGRLESAQDYAEEALGFAATTPKTQSRLGPPVHHFLGVLALESGQPDEATRQLELAVDLGQRGGHPGGPSLMRLRAEILRATGRPDEGVAVLRRGLDGLVPGQRPTDEAALLTDLARLELETNRLTAAAETWQQASARAEATDVPRCARLAALSGEIATARGLPDVALWTGAEQLAATIPHPVLQAEIALRAGLDAARRGALGHARRVLEQVGERFTLLLVEVPGLARRIAELEALVASDGADVVVDIAAGTLTVRGECHELGTRSVIVRLASLLIRAAPEPVGVGELCRRLWRHEGFNDKTFNRLKVHTHRLRTLLGAQRDGIKTVPPRGRQRTPSYRWSSDVPAVVRERATSA